RNALLPKPILRQLGNLRDQTANAISLDELRGLEGAAAAAYFQNFALMLKEKDWAFEFNGRNRRPPRDPVNALLSLGYSILAKELTGIAFSLGLDPHLGFFHRPRFGRPALALDMME